MIELEPNKKYIYSGIIGRPIIISNRSKLICRDDGTPYWFYLYDDEKRNTINHLIEKEDSITDKLQIEDNYMRIKYMNDTKDIYAIKIIIKIADIFYR